jgi:hypothetical protein
MSIAHHPLPLDMMGNYKIGDVMLHLIHSELHVPENQADDGKGF